MRLMSRAQCRDHDRFIYIIYKPQIRVFSLLYAPNVHVVSFILNFFLPHRNENISVYNETKITTAYVVEALDPQLHYAVVILVPFWSN